MSIMAFEYKVVASAPILVAFNREERYDRASQAPKIQSGRPRVICGIDRKSGGTWFGINQHSMFCCCIDRIKRDIPYSPRSRGLLCRELLNCRNASDAAQMAAAELASGVYAGVNYICGDMQSAHCIYGGNRIEIIDIQPGLHMFSNGNMDDYNDERQEFCRRQLTLSRLDTSVAFLAVSSRAFSKKAEAPGRKSLIEVGTEYGTVSSILLSLPSSKHGAILQYAPGNPSEVNYDDHSALLRQVLSTDRSNANRQAAIAKEELPE